MELRIHYRSSEGVYRTEDGRYQIERGVISTGWCECVIIPCSHGPEGGYMDTHGWWVWDNEHDDYAFDHETWSTMREARAALANLYANMTEPEPRRVKYPRPTKGETVAPEKKEPKCKACDQPDRYVAHSCGLKKLQDMLSFGPSPKRRRR